MLSQLGVIFVMVGSHGGLLDGAVHALDLAVGLGVIGFGQTVIDVVAGTGQLESMGAEEFSAR